MHTQRETMKVDKYCKVMKESPKLMGKMLLLFAGHEYIQYVYGETQCIVAEA